MFEAPLALAFVAGLVATLNPCGFAMLPAYLSGFLALPDDGEDDLLSALRRALLVGGTVSTGFLAVFGVAGVAVTLGFRQLIGAIPWAALVIGVLVAGLGVVLLTGRELRFGLPQPSAGVSGSGLGSMATFGVLYAVASLSCTLPIFLTVVAGVSTQGSLAAGVVTFLVYGAGMALVLLGVTIAVAAGKGQLLRRLRRASGAVNRVSGGILVLAGAYVVWFWGTNLVAGTPPQAARSPAGVVEGLSAWLTTLVGEHPVLWGTGLAAVVGGAIVATLVAGRSHAPGRSDAPGTEPDPDPQQVSR